MSTDGILRFQNTKKATFVGPTSNISFDTVNSSLGIGVTGDDVPSSNLYITGNAYVSSNLALGGVLTMGTVNVVARHSLQAVTEIGNTTSLTTEFTNPTTSLVASGNVEVGKELTVSGNVEVGTANLFVDTVSGRVGVGTTNPSSQLELYGAGKDLTFKYDTGITRQSAENRDAYYSGLENSIKRVGDRNVFDGSPFTPETTHEILFGFSDTYTQWSGLNQYYPQYMETRFKLWSPSNSTSGSLTDVMTLRGDGNVGIGTTSPNYTLDVNGDANISSNLMIGGQPVQAQRRWDIDLTAQSSSNFYPIALVHGPVTNGGDYAPVNFKVVGKSFGHPDPFNESTLIGYARGGGWSDHAGFCKVHYTRFSNNERRYQGIYEASENASNIIVIYMRGDYTYSLYTDADDVIVNTSAYTNQTSTFAIKDQSGNDVSGTSTNIIQLQNIADSSATEQTQTTGNFVVNGSVGIGTTSPETKLDVNGVIKSAVPSWGVHQLATNTGLLRMTDTHATARNCTVALSTGDPARTRVTATVAGRYFVSFMAFSEYSVPSGQSVQITLRKNGNTHARNFAIQPITNYSATGGIAVIVDLAVNDYLEIDSTNDLHGNDNGYFSGFLIG